MIKSRPKSIKPIVKSGKQFKRQLLKCGSTPFRKFSRDKNLVGQGLELRPFIVYSEFVRTPRG